MKIKKNIYITLSCQIIYCSLPMQIFAGAGDEITNSFGSSSIMSDNSQDITSEDFKFEEVEEYILKRTIKIKDRLLGLYEHEKTGALVVCCQMIDKKEDDAGDDESFEIFFRAPSENNKGTNHALEHCILGNLLCRDTLANGQAIPTGIKFSVDNTSFSSKIFRKVLNFSQEFETLLEQLNNPGFLYSDSIFDIQVYNKIPRDDGQNFTIGRLFAERQKEFARTASCESDKYTELLTGSKFQFNYAGLPEDILKLEKSELVDVYNKYIHPSNSLSIIQSHNYKNMLNKINTEYFSKYDKKNIEVSFDTNDCDETERYINSNQKFDKSCFNYEYCAYIFYDLKDYNAEELEQFELFNNVFVNNYKSLTNKLKQEGYGDIVINFDSSNGYPYMILELYGDNMDLFKQEILIKNISEFINNINITDLDLMDWDEFDQYKSVINSYSLFNKIYNSFAIYQDPFSNKCFNIDDNIVTERKILIEQNILKNLVPKKISILKPDENNYKTYHFNFNISDCDNILIKEIIINILNNYILNENLYKFGVFYAPFQISVIDKQMSLYTDEKLGVEYTVEFFNNKLKQVLNEFEITDEILEKTKETLQSYKTLMLSSFSEEEKKFIKNLTTQEIQDNFKKIEFLGLTTN